LERNRWIEHEAVMAANGGNLMKRIRRLLQVSEPRRGAALPALLAVLLSLCAAVALAWPSPQARVPSTRAQDVLSPYQRWLNEHIAYIITDSERGAFNLLQSDAEREYFIEQFWLRRDPTPGTPDNEFKEEHYRRIAYANERFGTSSLAGWKTDRGRIYI